MPQRAVIPPAPKPPSRPEGIAASASAMGSALGIETAYQKEQKAHEAAMKAWRETVKGLRQQEAKSWESLRAMAAIAPIKRRSLRPATVPPDLPVSPKAQPNAARSRPR
jgi:hypothetical protein